MNPKCFEKHPSARGMRCDLAPGHDGPHRHTYTGTVWSLGEYERHESPDYMDGGVTAAQIEKEAEKHDDDFATADFARHPHRGVAARHRKGKLWAWVAGPMQELFRDDEMAAQGWSPVRECPDPEQHRDPLDFQTSFPSPAKGMRYQRERDEARAMAGLWRGVSRRLVRDRNSWRLAAQTSATDAEDAKEERDEARARLAEAEQTIREQVDVLDELAAGPRPLTPDADAYERGVPVLRDACPGGFKLSIPAHEAVRAIVSAVLAEPVEDPEVVALAEVLGDFAVADEHNGTRDDMQLARLLHGRGVRRVVGDE